MFGLFRKERKQDNFWDWLSVNSARIRNVLPQNFETIGEEIGQVFTRYYPELAWEISPSRDSASLFCVSADGNGAFFPRVLDAVNAAPEIPGWKIQAFRPRGPLTVKLEMGGRKLDYDDIWRDVAPLDGGVHVILLIRGLTPEDPKLGGAALILLDNAVGEYDAVMKIKKLGRGALPSHPERSDRFFPLRELPGFLDGIEDV